MTSTVLRTGDAPTAQLVSAPIHLGCFMDTIAGRVSENVLEALESGEPATALEREGDGDLNDDLVELAERLVERFLR